MIYEQTKDNYALLLVHIIYEVLCMMKGAERKCNKYVCRERRNVDSLDIYIYNQTNQATSLHPPAVYVGWLHYKIRGKEVLRLTSLLYFIFFYIFLKNLVILHLII